MTMELLLELWYPVLFILITISHLPRAIYVTVFEDGKLSISSLRDRWFALFWREFGPGSRKRAEPTVTPMLREVQGRVLDVGTGGGHWLSLYDASKITRLLAVETNREQHPSIHERARAAGLAGVIEVTTTPVERLQADLAIKPASFDTVVTINVLCSAHSPETLAPAAYQLLAPGGSWVLYEHVRARSPWFVVRWQSMLNTVWPFFLGGCSLCRDTDKLLRDAGKWRADSVGMVKDQSEYSVIPSVAGILRK